MIGSKYDVEFDSGSDLGSSIDWINSTMYDFSSLAQVPIAFSANVSAMGRTSLLSFSGVFRRAERSHTLSSITRVIIVP